MTPKDQTPPTSTQRTGAALVISALGVVFGDIGTSPLYTLSTVFGLTGGNPTSSDVLGIVSLIFWTLVIIVAVKYVSFAMRMDNDGEGGILALMSLVGAKRQRWPAIIAIGLFGAALIYGDGAITPAISVLSALEGLEIGAPALNRYIVPLAVLILVALFLAQAQGTARIGRAFGPVMGLWFLTIAALGLKGISEHPSILAAVNPLYAARYLAAGGYTSFLVLGGVFLSVTGAEALYADMGHFGARPIRIGWYAVVFPSLILNYAGQGAHILAAGSATTNPFYELCPAYLVLPLTGLATLATIIASQSIITGAFSMTRQAIRLGWMPHMRITQTSEEGYGQIYVSAVNWLLMIATIALTIAFKKSTNLASAYGIAVSATMLMTTMLLFIATRKIWGWGLLTSSLVAGVFLIVDGTFFSANLTKIAEGGYVPLLLALAVYAVMYIWHRGISAITERVEEKLIPIGRFMAELAAKGIARPQGTAIFLTRTLDHTPPVVAWYVDHAKSLQENVVAITVTTLSRPRVAESDRLSITEIAPRFWRVVARYGFMERPDMPRLLIALKASGCAIDLAGVTYYVGLESVVPREDRKGLPRWLVSAFAALLRNSAHVSDAFNFPRDRVMEIGRQIAI